MNKYPAAMAISTIIYADTGLSQELEQDIPKLTPATPKLPIEHVKMLIWL
jgi:hypothetical protein